MIRRQLRSAGLVLLVCMTAASARGQQASTKPPQGKPGAKLVGSPVLGHAGSDFFTVTCRMNMKCRLSLRVGDKTAESPMSALHTFRIDGLTSDTRHEFTFTAAANMKGQEVTNTHGPYSVRTFPAYKSGGKDYRLEFVVLGDSRVKVGVWWKVGRLVASKKPHFVIHSGDLVSDGRNPVLWNREFLWPGKALLSAIPMYAVYGNHDKHSPTMLKMIRSPNGKAQWDQVIGPVHLIGIDSQAGWGAASGNAKWLESVLARSKAKYIFLVGHYPPYSSSMHGLLEGDRPKEIEAHFARSVILPMLAKHKATAFVAGHDHTYERSEPDSGVTVVISGGAGAHTYTKNKDAEKQNPFSKVFSSRHHYCLFTVTDTSCKLTAIDLEGNELDTREWKPRGAG